DLLVWEFLVELGLDGELRIVLLLRTGQRRHGGQGRGEFANSQRRSRRQRAHHKATAVHVAPHLVVMHHVAPNRTSAYTSITAILLGSFVPSRCPASAAVAI